MTQLLNQMSRKIRGIHFVGIGGIGMSGIAEVLHNLGYVVTGSDLAPSDNTERLTRLGIPIRYGHFPSNVGAVDVVVTSTAVKQDNPEVLEAWQRRIPVVPRAEMLAELLKVKFSIAVSGSHGKTTTTSLIASLLAQAGLDPTMVIGGKLASIGTNARLGEGEIIVAEADESDRSFLLLAPTLAVITNIDREHLDHYRDLDEIKDAFVEFANRVPFYVAVVLCGDDERVISILPRIKRRTITYGIEEGVEFRARDIVYEKGVSLFSLQQRGETIGLVRLNAPGKFNVLNALAAIAVAFEIGLSLPDILPGLATFAGVKRRLELKGCRSGVTVVDDYGHHPTEIRATLAAAKPIWEGRCHVVFQPHRYSRTQALFEEFSQAFSEVDNLIITDIYPAGEDPIPGIDGRHLACAVSKVSPAKVTYVPGFEEIVSILLSEAQKGDVVLTMGAGNIWKVGEKFLAHLPPKGKP
jgi:UDP-N-acetylmuramate--alanine ligase